MNIKRFPTGHMVVLLVLILSVGCWPANGQVEEAPDTEVSGVDPSSPRKNQEDMSETFEGTVMEVIDTGRHIYVRIDTGEKRVWVAVPELDGKVGDLVIVPPGIPSAHYHSKTLNRDFEMIYFVGGIHRVDESMAK